MKRIAATLLLLTILLGLMVEAPTSAQDASPTTVADALPTCASGADAAGTPTVATAEMAAWQTTSMTDVRTGEDFTVTDFLGCAVYVETMATWCGECRRQLENVAKAVVDLDRNEHVIIAIIAISVETDLPDEDLARYAEDAGFDWVFAVASPDLLKAIVDEFGRGAIVPPSTPHVIIEPDGSYGELRTGFTDPEDIVTLMTQTSAT